MAGSHPLSGLRELWDEVIADLEATESEYREEGWETLSVHPGDVTPLPSAATVASEVEVDRTGLDLLLPGNEYRELQEFVEGVAFDEYDAFRASESDVVFLVITMKSTESGRAVLFPLYYSVSDSKVMLSRAAERGEMRTFLRPLDDSSRVVFSQQDPENLLPDGFDPMEVDEDDLAVDVPPELDDPLDENIDVSDDDIRVEVDDGVDGVDADQVAADEASDDAPVDESDAAADEASDEE